MTCTIPPTPLAEVFRRPQILYFHLSSTLAPGSAPEIARLVTYCLLCAATRSRGRRQVFLVIDEFQRMVARNLEYILQLARSMDVGVILANQTMRDLRTSKADLIAAIEANCRFRQWFSVSANEDRDRLTKSSGLTMEMTFAESWLPGLWPYGGSYTYTATERPMPRFSLNDILLASDHPRRSIVTITRGAGYAQYGGLPILIESEYHISAEEYRRRRSLPWPENEPGTFIPKGHQERSATAGRRARTGPLLTTEIIGNLPDLDPPDDDEEDDEQEEEEDEESPAQTQDQDRPPRHERRWPR